MCLKGVPLVSYYKGTRNGWKGYLVEYVNVHQCQGPEISFFTPPVQHVETSSTSAVAPVSQARLSGDLGILTQFSDLHLFPNRNVLRSTGFLTSL